MPKTIFFIFEISRILNRQNFESKHKNRQKPDLFKMEKIWSKICGTFVEPSRKINTIVGKYRSRSWGENTKLSKSVQKCKSYGISKLGGYIFWKLWLTFWKIENFDQISSFLENRENADFQIFWKSQNFRFFKITIYIFKKLYPPNFEML